MCPEWVSLLPVEDIIYSIGGNQNLYIFQYLVVFNYIVKRITNLNSIIEIAWEHISNDSI